MNVLLICPKPQISTRTDSAPLGILSIATYLKEKGHTVRFIDREVYPYDVGKIIGQFKPALIGIAVMSTKAIPDALAISEKARRAKIPVVWGGTFTSLIADLVLKSGKVDFVAIGEGEITTLELIDSLGGGLPLEQVDGLAYVKDGKIVYNKSREFTDLADFPVIDWSLVDARKYFRAYFGCEKMVYLYGSKGCPGQCTFCMNKEYHRCTHRKRPMAYVLNEIKYLVTNCGLDGVYFSDENCCGTRAEMHVFCDSIKSTGLPFVWGCQTRINGFLEEDFQYMYSAGCRWIYFGIESGSKERLATVKKGIAYDKIEQTVVNCHKAGIVAITGFIIGFPDEEEDELRQTIALACSMPFSMRAFHHFIPVPGSEIYARLIEQDRYSPPETLEEMTGMSPADEIIKNFSRIPTRELNVVYTYFMMTSFARKKPNASTKSYGFAIKIVKEQLRDIFKGGLLSSMKNLFKTAKTFMKYLYYYYCFPRIRKKYGLYGN